LWKHFSNVFAFGSEVLEISLNPEIRQRLYSDFKSTPEALNSCFFVCHETLNVMGKILKNMEDGLIVQVNKYCEMVI